MSGNVNVCLTIYNYDDLVFYFNDQREKVDGGFLDNFINTERTKTTLVSLYHFICSIPVNSNYSDAIDQFERFLDNKFLVKYAFLTSKEKFEKIAPQLSVRGLKQLPLLHSSFVFQQDIPYMGIPITCVVVPCKDSLPETPGQSSSNSEDKGLQSIED